MRDAPQAWVNRVGSIRDQVRLTAQVPGFRQIARPQGQRWIGVVGQHHVASTGGSVREDERGKGRAIDGDDTGEFIAIFPVILLSLTLN